MAIGEHRPFGINLNRPAIFPMPTRGNPLRRAHGSTSGGVRYPCPYPFRRVCICHVVSFINNMLKAAGPACLLHRLRPLIVYFAGFLQRRVSPRSLAAWDTARLSQRGTSGRIGNAVCFIVLSFAVCPRAVVLLHFSASVLTYPIGLAGQSSIAWKIQALYLRQNFSALLPSISTMR